MNFLKYSLLRLGILVALFVLCLYLGLGLVFSGIAAVIAAFAVCYIFFPKLHYAAGQDFHRFISRSPKPLSPRNSEASAKYLGINPSGISNNRMLM